jgi:hypothetical protein
MSEYLVKKKWGYQTCCPDEENTVGYFRPENHDTINFYDGPSFDRNILDKIKSRKHENWKYNAADGCNLTLKEMDDKFGFMYEVENLDLLIHKSNGIWGWEEVKDKDNEITWIKISEDNDVWAPYDYYDSDSESDTNPQDD